MIYKVRNYFFKKMIKIQIIPKSDFCKIGGFLMKLNNHIFLAAVPHLDYSCT